MLLWQQPEESWVFKVFSRILIQALIWFNHSLLFAHNLSKTCHKYYVMSHNWNRIKVGIPGASGVGRLPNRSVVVEGVPYSDFSILMPEVFVYWRSLNLRSDNDFTISFSHLRKLIFKYVHQDLLENQKLKISSGNLFLPFQIILYVSTFKHYRVFSMYKIKIWASLI